MSTMKYVSGEPETMDYSGVSLRWIIATAGFVKRLMLWTQLGFDRQGEGDWARYESVLTM